MNGLTGEKMQRIYKALVPAYVSNDARNLVEYCCFRFLSRDSSEIHPSLKVSGFRLLFDLSFRLFISRARNVPFVFLKNFNPFTHKWVDLRYVLSLMGYMG